MLDKNDKKKKKAEQFSFGLLPFYLEEELYSGCNGWNTNLSRGNSKRVSRSFKMCSNPDELHLRLLKQFAAVITSASVLRGGMWRRGGAQRSQKEWENCQKIRAKQMPQISKRGILQSKER